jgi:hypothetical protein
MLALAAVMLLALAFPSWSGWHPVALILVPMLGAVAARRFSLLATVVLVQVAVTFGVAWFVLGGDRGPELVALVVVWSAGLAVGAGLSGPAPRTESQRVWQPPRWPHVAIAVVLIAVQAAQVVGGSSGFRAQLATGMSTPAGPAGIASTAGPVLIGVMLLAALGSGRRLIVAATLAAAQAGVLALSAFRGAAMVFGVSSIIAAALSLPRASPWRRPQRMVPACLLLVGVALAGFLVAATVRDRTATEMGLSSSGTRVIAASDAVPYIAARLDLGQSLTRAIDRKDDPDLAEAASWRFQAQAFVPRSIWPDKPILDYGQRISAAAYGMRQSRSSSTISMIGDALINVGPGGVALVAVLLGFGVAFAERRIRAGAGVWSLVTAVALSVAVLGQESPLPLTAARLLRDVLVVGFLWLGADALVRRRERIRRPPDAPGEDPARDRVADAGQNGDQSRRPAKLGG